MSLLLSHHSNQIDFGLQINANMKNNNREPEEPKSRWMKWLYLLITVIIFITTAVFATLTSDMIVAITHHQKITQLIGANADIPNVLLSAIITILSIVLTVKYYSFYKNHQDD
jgi:hypothetical protein